MKRYLLLLTMALAVWTLSLIHYFQGYLIAYPISGIFVSLIKENKDTPIQKFQKPFIYLTQTESCLPPNLATSLGNATACNCDVIVLSYKTPCENKEVFAPHISYLLGPNSTWMSGRNILFFSAIDRKPGYQYYIFMDNDIQVTFSKFTPPEIAATLQPFRAFEEWLLDYEPAVGVLDYNGHDGAEIHFKRRRDVCGINETSLVIPVFFSDALFGAFHFKAVTHLLPYREEADELGSWWLAHKNVISNAEIKFRGQVLMFTALIINNPTHRPYPRRLNLATKLKVWRGWIRGAQRLAPIEHRNNILFRKLLDQLWTYSHKADTLCMNATKHQPIVPYAHFMRN